MPQKNTLPINKWLLPFSWLYSFIVFIRNKCFDWGIFKQESFDIPVICVGNITVGGTGKTPHVEYLIEILKPHFKVAVLSRGYKRKTKGFILASSDSTALQIGDEPYQIKLKYPDVLVAVDGNRRRGIQALLALPQNFRPDIILLDDAFQHRYVKPSFIVLLTDYNRLMTHDRLLPAGRLREPLHHTEKANMIIVTKCPSSINPLEQRIISKDIQAYPYQDLFFTTFRYGDLLPVFADSGAKPLPLQELKNRNVLAITGIANPRPFYRVIKKQTRKVSVLEFPDHHMFKQKDIDKIVAAFNGLDAEKRIVVVTEKDAARFRSIKKIDESFRQSLYYLPIQIKFVNSEDQNIFNSKIIEHARKNQTDI